VSEAQEQAPLRLTVPYRARFDECGPDGSLRSAGFVRWAQDCAWVHSERLGFSRAWYADRGLGWLVRCAELNIRGSIALGETIEVTTEITGFRRVWARRRTGFRRETGEEIATALTDWVLVDARGAPTRLPEEFSGPMGGRLGSFTPGRVLLPPAPSDASVRPISVRPADLDPMAHANNAAFVDYLDESLGPAGVAGWSGRLPRRYRLEYLAPARPGSGLNAQTWPMGDGVAHRLIAGDGSDVLRATLDGRTAREDLRRTLTERRPTHAPGKDTGVD